VVSLCCWAPGAAFAAAGSSTGVHADPGSPAGKEYAIPITTARIEASGRPTHSGTSNPPLFGAGITRSRSHASSSTRAGSPSQSTTRARTAATPSRSIQKRRRGASTGASRSAASLTTRTQSSSVGASGWLPLIGGGVLMLVIGCGGGLLLRRHSG
jgi:cobalamin biosynthesis Mg chelatase CobN